MTNPLKPIDSKKGSKINFSEAVRENIKSFRENSVKHRLEGSTDYGILRAVYELNNKQKQLLCDFLIARYNYLGDNTQKSNLARDYKKRLFLNELPSQTEITKFNYFFSTTNSHLIKTPNWGNYSDPYLNLAFTFGLAKGDGSHPAMDIEICEAFQQTQIINDQQVKEDIRIAQENALDISVENTEEPSNDINPLTELMKSSSQILFLKNMERNSPDQKNQQSVRNDEPMLQQPSNTQSATDGLAKGDGSHPAMDIEICEAFQQTEIINDQQIKEDARIAQENAADVPVEDIKEPSNDINPLTELMKNASRIPLFSNMAKNLLEQKNQQLVGNDKLMSQQPNTNNDTTEITSKQTRELSMFITFSQTLFMDADHIVRQNIIDIVGEIVSFKISTEEMSTNTPSH